MSVRRVVRATLSSVVAAGAALSCAGCSDYRDGTRPPQVATSSLAHCASSADQLPTFDDRGEMAGSGRVPDGFAAVRVLRCTWTEVYTDSATKHSRITMQEFRSSTVSAALLDALALPDQDFAPLSDMACDLVGRVPQYLVLVDAAGHAVMPRPPRTPCGDLRDEVVGALAGLDWPEIRTYRFTATHA